MVSKQLVRSCLLYYYVNPLDYEALKEAIEDNSQTYGDLAEHFQLSDKTKRTSHASHREGVEDEHVSTPHRQNPTSNECT